MWSTARWTAVRWMAWMALSMGIAACGSEEGGSEATADAADGAGEPDGSGGDAGGDASGDVSGGEDAVAPLDASGDADVDPSTWGCWDDLEIGQAVVFAEEFDGGTEGIAFGPGGHLYVSARADGVIWRLDAAGSREPFATIPTSLGLAGTPSLLIVAALGEDQGPKNLDGSVQLVGEAGDVSELAHQIADPNFVLRLPSGDVLLSDDFDTRVWRITPSGDVSAVIEDIESPNGMGLSPNGAWLYVASTFTPRGEITRFPIGPDGLPDGSAGEEIGALGAAAVPDGLAVDILGDIYVAANFRGTIERIPAAGGAPSVIASKLTNPASLAFGVADGFDPCSIYVTELFGARVWRVAVGRPGVRPAGWE